MTCFGYGLFMRSVLNAKKISTLLQNKGRLVRIGPTKGGKWKTVEKEHDENH